MMTPHNSLQTQQGWAASQLPHRQDASCDCSILILVDAEDPRSLIYAQTGRNNDQLVLVQSAPSCHVMSCRGMR
jgi:hypothetical protein